MRGYALGVKYFAMELKVFVHGLTKDYIHTLLVSTGVLNALICVRPEEHLLKQF